MVVLKVKHTGLAKDPLWSGKRKRNMKDDTKFWFIVWFVLSE